MKPKPYDFRNPERPASDLEQFLGNWLRATAHLAKERWDRTIAETVGLKFHQVEVLPSARVFARVPQGCFGYRLAVSHSAARKPEGPGDMLLVWPRAVARALVALAMGDPPSEWPADRELTAVEISIGEYLIQSLLADLLQGTWPQPAGIQLRVVGTEPSPRFTRLFAQAEQVYLCSGSFSAKFGEEDWYWLIPVPGQLAASVQLGANPSKPSASSGRPIESLVPEMRVELVVQLGSGEIPLSQVGSLRVGDLLMLDQKAGDPLPIQVNGTRKFQAYPGRVGARQAVQIQSVEE